MASFAVNRKNQPTIKFSRGQTMILHSFRSALLAVIVIGLPVLACAAGQDEKPDPVALWSAVQDVTTTLEKGIVSSEPHGKPISAKFEIENGDLQLSVYTMTSDGFAEVLVDPKTAAVLKAEKIDDSEDLANAASQKAAMDKAKMSLRAAVEKALRDNSGA